MVTEQPVLQPNLHTEADFYASLMLRLWRGEAGEQITPDWYSEVDHIQSGRHWDFTTLTELESFLIQFLNQLAKIPE